jgi:CHAT domain-containing protein
MAGGDFRKLAWLFAVTTVALTIVVTARWHLRERDPLAGIVSLAAKAPRRAVEPRLAGFPFAPFASRARGSDQQRELLRLRSAALELIALRERSHRAADLHIVGIGRLIEGQHDAVNSLREASSVEPANARYLNDLAAAMYVRARADQDPQELAMALASIDRALYLQPASQEALFNRALILEAFPLREHAVAAWERYLAFDAQSPWADEARARRDRLRQDRAQTDRSQLFAIVKVPTGGDEAVLGPLTDRFPEEARRLAESTLFAEWAKATLGGDDVAARARLADIRVIGKVLNARRGDALLADAVVAIDGCGGSVCRILAEGHRAYDEGRRLYGGREVARALELFRIASSRFRTGGSPLLWTADYYTASCLDDQSDPKAFQRIFGLLAVVPQSYKALRAQLYWQSGTIHSRTDRVVDALGQYERALGLFKELEERNNANRMRSSVAAMNSLLGRSAVAWRHRADAFAALPASGEEGTLQVLLELVARMEAVEQRWGVSASFFALSLEEGFRINPRLEASALLWRALVLGRLGRTADARQEIDAARLSVASVKDVSLKTEALDDLAFAEAAIVRSSDPARSAVLMESFIDSAEQRHRTLFLAEAYLERARAELALRNSSAAAGFFRRALDVVDGRRDDTSAGGIVDVYFATATSATMELVGLLQSENKIDEAFSVLERARGRSLNALRTNRNGQRVALRPEEIAAKLPGDIVLLSYLLLHDRVVAFTIRRDEGLRGWSIPHSRKSVIEGIARLRSVIERNEASAIAAESRALHRILIEPLKSALSGARTWAVITDPAMEELPFSALNDASGRSVLETASVVYVPSAKMFVTPPTSRPAANGELALIIGNPTLDRTAFASLAPLPAAKSEAEELARRYGNAIVLTDGEATSERFLELLPAANTIHVAAHSLTMRHDPMHSMLVMAPTAQRSGAVYAEEVVRRGCSARVVVLAACRTASLSEVPSDVATLARAFIVAGARHVVGTLWNVDDEETAIFSKDFHEQLGRSATPADALHRAQRALARNHPPRVWAAFVVLSAGSDEILVSV